MSPLALKLFDRRFQDLMEIGRARLPALAPEWTDHNAHDPGITLMELLAWVAEAQMYSLSHLRRDERVAFASMLGISPAGTHAATGLIWPDRKDPNSPAATFAKTSVISEESIVNVVDTDEPTFRPTHPLLFVPGQILKLETKGPRGRTTDNTAVNERGGVAFLPFGGGSGRRQVLSMTFAGRDREGLFGSNRQNTKGALWPIGIMVPPSVGGTSQAKSSAASHHSPLTAKLVANKKQFNLPIVSDSTEGLFKTGVLLLDLDGVTESPREFTIELRAPNGFSRPPRVLRIDPNVIPILQGYKISGELHESKGEPDWSFPLNVPGLRFESGDEPVTISVGGPTGLKAWRRCDRVSEQGPTDEVYEFDLRTNEITFGNGVNGRIPPAEAQVTAAYAVSEGEAGGVARNRKWGATGIEGTFGVNPDPIAGGSGSFGWIDQRREARRRSRNDHALVSSEDIRSAALAIPLLEVARAWVVGPGERTPRTGVVTLVVMRRRPDENEPDDPPETPRWLSAIRRELVPRMPLGTRLVVTAPHYRDFSINAVVETEVGLNPATVKKSVEEQLQIRLALFESATVTTPRQPGVPVTSRDVSAWIRKTKGVKRVVQRQLRYANGKNTNAVMVLRTGLPRWIRSLSNIEAVRPQPGGSNGR